jgi:hypothetical protein
VPRRGLVAAGRTGVVGDRLTDRNPLTTPLTHVVGASPLQLTVLVKALRQGCPKTKRMVAEASKEWVEIRLMDLADSPYSTTSQKISALEFLGKNLGMF